MPCNRRAPHTVQYAHAPYALYLHNLYRPSPLPSNTKHQADGRCMFKGLFSQRERDLHHVQESSM
jgi:hypothetical protein